MSSKEAKSEGVSGLNDSGLNDVVHIQKMLFIFNAIIGGWTVKMVGKNTFEFKKNRKNQEVNLENYLKNFVLQNLSIDNIPT